MDQSPNAKGFNVQFWLLSNTWHFGWRQKSSVLIWSAKSTRPLHHLWQTENGTAHFALSSLPHISSHCWFSFNTDFLLDILPFYGVKDENSPASSRVPEIVFTQRYQSKRGWIQLNTIFSNFISVKCFRNHWSFSFYLTIICYNVFLYHIQSWWSSWNLWLYKAWKSSSYFWKTICDMVPIGISTLSDTLSDKVQHVFTLLSHSPEGTWPWHEAHRPARVNGCNKRGRHVFDVSGLGGGMWRKTLVRIKGKEQGNVKVMRNRERQREEGLVRRGGFID